MTPHQPFLTRPNYHADLSVEALRRAAKSARAAGYYSIATLWLFRQSWLSSGSLADYLHYLAFRRDLGYPLTPRQAKRLQSWFQQPLARYWWQIKNRSSASLLKRLLQTTAGNPANIERKFQQYLQQAGQINLVGNSGQLTGASYGNAIDKAGAVIRFNRCFSQHTRVQDTGQKTDIWVAAPDFKLAAPPANWYILTGPDMLNWITTLPPALASKQLVLSVPLAVWRRLVRQLAAPPSAGILTLSWLFDLAPKATITIYGFTLSNSHLPYHHADPTHQAVSRHHWQAEQRLLSKWLNSQLIQNGFKE